MARPLPTAVAQPPWAATTTMSTSPAIATPMMMHAPASRLRRASNPPVSSPLSPHGTPPSPASTPSATRRARTSTVLGPGSDPPPPLPTTRPVRIRIHAAASGALALAAVDPSAPRDQVAGVAVATCRALDADTAGTDSDFTTAAGGPLVRSGSISGSGSAKPGALVLLPDGSELDAAAWTAYLHEWHANPGMPDLPLLVFAWPVPPAARTSPAASTTYPSPAAASTTPPAPPSASASMSSSTLLPDQLDPIAAAGPWAQLRVQERAAVALSAHLDPLLSAVRDAMDRVRTTSDAVTASVAHVRQDLDLWSRLAVGEGRTVLDDAEEKVAVGEVRPGQVLAGLVGVQDHIRNYASQLDSLLHPIRDTLTAPPPLTTRASLRSNPATSLADIHAAVSTNRALITHFVDSVLARTRTRTSWTDPLRRLTDLVTLADGERAKLDVVADRWRTRHVPASAALVVERARREAWRGVVARVDRVLGDSGEGGQGGDEAGRIVDAWTTVLDSDSAGGDAAKPIRAVLAASAVALAKVAEEVVAAVDPWRVRLATSTRVARTDGDQELDPAVVRLLEQMEALVFVETGVRGPPRGQGTVESVNAWQRRVNALSGMVGLGMGAGLGNT
ncbi:hypothetical protein AMAG_12970 [Allomyces macrogynus ATCC 38327]|uniref:Uncharacterized protein n=1 Tax=Allomyces macrogynus (strain ATCC 38327) TaxID=578462 RepID=A0A0L0T0M1_ALLM3|nr:hypothetical protein AMAG_12970 [Allomyces macrogynus ATCC 38327]|eukprot:KNE68302.1 hypothetical protein AMAG_12970 [Allomyces macrogynus ATCC 38327]